MPCTGMCLVRPVYTMYTSLLRSRSGRSHARGALRDYGPSGCEGDYMYTRFENWSDIQSGAPNDQFVEKCVIIPQLMKIYVIKAF